MTAVPRVMLNNGAQIPQLGFGVWQVPRGQTKKATLAALEIGYRHIDTAQMYRNEQGVGEAVRESGIERDLVFVTSKLNNGFHEYGAALKAFDVTLETLGFDYLDLFLIHWPLPKVGDFVETWTAMEEIYRSGRSRSIGVSNFQPHHLRRLRAETTVTPVVNQIEVHPYLVQDDVRAVNAELGIATQAWSPMAHGKVLDDPTVGEIARRVERTAAQVVLRWHVQRGDIIFPKSVNRARIEENFGLFDFELDDGDMSSITALDRGERTGPDPDQFNWIPR